MTTTTTSIAAAGGGGGGEDRVLATAQHIRKSLGNTPKEVREDMLLIFSSFDNRLSNLTSMISDESKKEDDRFEATEKVIFRWESNHDSMMRGSAVPWEDSPDELTEYLLAVDEILSLMEGFTVGLDHENGEVKKRKSKVLENGEVDGVEEQQVKRKKRRKS